MAGKMTGKRRSARPHRVKTTHPRYAGDGYNRGGGSIFFESKMQKYSEMVRIDTVEEAQISAERLQDEFDKAKQMAKKRRLIQVANLASNRATVMSKNKKLSTAERRDAVKMARIYRKVQVGFSKSYQLQKKKLESKKKKSN